MVAHVLHTPLTAIDDADVDTLVEWFEDAGDLLKQLRP